MITLTLDYPPSANRYWRHNQGRIHRSQEADAYKHYVGLLCMTRGVEVADGDVAITLNFYRPAKKGDLDNRIKVLLDALNGFAYVDDKQVAEIHAKRFEDKQNPRVEVIVQEIG